MRVILIPNTNIEEHTFWRTHLQYLIKLVNEMALIMQFCSNEVIAKAPENFDAHET